MASISSKLPDVKTTIFTVMSQMAADHNAINLSQGFPDFNCSGKLISLVEKYMREGFNQYAPMPGVLKLREKISQKIEKLYRKKYNPQTEIVITAGATEAIYTAAACSIQKDDEVILFEPAYDSYAPSVAVHGGRPVFIPLDNKDFFIDWQRVKDAVTPRTKMIILNSPHNPTGSVITEQDIKNLEDVTRNSNILLLSDEVYEHIIFDGKKHLSLSSSEELSSRAFVISSFGKTYHATGWKTGYCAAPENMMSEFKKIHQFLVFAVNTPIQHAYADYLEFEEEYLDLNSFYQNKRDLMLQQLADSKFNFNPAAGTYFQLLDYSSISGLNDFEFVKYLTKEIGVAAIPLSPFYSDKRSINKIRICFAKKDEVLIEAAEKLNKVSSI